MRTEIETERAVRSAPEHDCEERKIALASDDCFVTIFNVPLIRGSWKHDEWQQLPTSSCTVRLELVRQIWRDGVPILGHCAVGQVAGEFAGIALVGKRGCVGFG